MPNARSIHVEIAAGELFDKITILQIKSERITDVAKRQNVQSELHVLSQSLDASIPRTSELDALTRDLKQINEALWDIEDEIRDCERRQDFGPRFIELARAVYKTNDRRTAVKRQINNLTGSRLVEEKSYAAY